MTMIDRFEALLASGKDNALLRFTLGAEYLKGGQPERAVEHLRAAVARDEGYSAAWKLLGKALESVGDRAGAAGAWRTGITQAEAKGDKQAAREMGVFLRRLEKSGEPPAG